MDSSSGFLAVTVDGMVAGHLRRVIGEKTRDALGKLGEVASSRLAAS